MSLDGLNSQAYQTFQHVGGRPSLLNVGDGASLAHKNATEQWAGSALNLGAQQAAAHKLDKVVTKGTGSPMPGQAGLSYSNIANLGTEQVRASQFSWEKMKQTVSKNISGFGKDLKAGNISPKTYFQETLWRRNVEPVKNLFTGNSTKTLGQGLINTGGAALVGYDVLKNTTATYKDAKAREDGSFSGKLNTAKETTVAFGKYGARDATSWEAASVGGAIGKAVMPISIKGVPIGGVLFGALGGVLGQKTMNHVLKTGDLDPVQQRKAIAKAEKKAAKKAEKSGHPITERNRNPDAGSGRVEPV